MPLKINCLDYLCFKTFILTDIKREYGSDVSSVIIFLSLLTYANISHHKKLSYQDFLNTERDLCFMNSNLWIGGIIKSLKLLILAVRRE